jgi:hypothetical protein
MHYRAFEASWRKHMLLGFQATLAAVATTILSLLAQGGVKLLCDWLSPGWIAGIPQIVATVIGIAYFVLFMLPLFGLLFSQVSGLGRSSSTMGGEVRDGRWRKREAEN